MKTSRISLITLFLAVILVSTSTAQAANSARYLVKTDKAFWKETLGSRYEYSDGFTANLSDIELRVTKLFGIDVEPVKMLHVLSTTKKTKNRDHSIPTDQIPWGLKVMYNDPTLTRASGGNGVSIAVLDTGVNIKHPDLKKRIVQCKDFTQAVPLVDGVCKDLNGHGTHSAGVIAADGGPEGKGIFGVAPEASILAYKVCDESGNCYADDVASAIKTAADQNVQIINLGLGREKDGPLLRDAISYAVSKGVMIVAPSGNDGPFLNSVDYPAAYPEVISVGAINKDLDVTDWSSRGDPFSLKSFVSQDHIVELVAPGENIESTSKEGVYFSLSGTSMATSFITGLAAKEWQFSVASPSFATRDLIHQLSHTLSSDTSSSGFGLPQVK